MRPFNRKAKCDIYFVKASHMKHQASINVPEETLNKGVTVKSIERSLHVEARSQWGRRTGDFF